VGSELKEIIRRLVVDVKWSDEGVERLTESLHDLIEFYVSARF